MTVGLRRGFNVLKLRNLIKIILVTLNATLYLYGIFIDILITMIFIRKYKIAKMKVKLVKCWLNL